MQVDDVLMIQLFEELDLFVGLVQLGCEACSAPKTSSLAATCFRALAEDSLLLEQWFDKNF